MNRNLLTIGLVLIFGATSGLVIRQRLLQRRYDYLRRPASFPIWQTDLGQKVSKGITRWQSTLPDGSTVELFVFDFTKNPNLRLELYDQDEDDAKPLDNRVAYWNNGLWVVTQKLDKRLARHNRRLLVLWNGTFFGLLNKKPREADRAFHLAPVVLNGKVFFNTGNHRWTWGVNYKNGKPHFQALHLPGREALEKNFDFAAGATQNLLADGKPLKVEPFPWWKQKPKPQPVASTPAEAGHIPTLDHMKTSRVSVGWTADSSKLFLLFVKEPDGETPSRAAVQAWKPAYGGWMLSDVQHFWQKEGAKWNVKNAVALDGGDTAQLALRGPANNWRLTPPRMALENPLDNATKTIEMTDAKTKPPSAIMHGGSLTYFYVSEAVPLHAPR